MDQFSYNTLSREDLMRKIQELEFATVDLNLFLDTHPDNADALKAFNEISRNANKLKKIYEVNFGPLTNFGYDQSSSPWAWVDEPWPWEKSSK
ncbi:polypeptide composition of the spore coat protein CotJB [Clostridium novyi A str. 4570]|uniref:Polypeptide composition of the spore coat protein CotJB n=1 Tax=Clostridium novyi A str. 4570 TaxID=1444290 RepID=A0AA88ZRI7_CLONO|nr:spore coat protein CotJB [Clostridium novyi]KGN03119.1 polypeptide composition of the spore coat protein CotJB [Clostridium novyi A str. 4570]